jgi:hypothetical protein
MFKKIQRDTRLALILELLQFSFVSNFANVERLFIRLNGSKISPKQTGNIFL